MMNQQNAVGLERFAIAMDVNRKKKELSLIFWAFDEAVENTFSIFQDLRKENRRILEVIISMMIL